MTSGGSTSCSVGWAARCYSAVFPSRFAQEGSLTKLTMLAVLCVTLGAPAPLHPSAGGLHLEGRLHCVSTAVDIKSERCDKACNGRESGLSCPSKCLCVRVPWPGAPQTVKSAKSVLHRLAKGLKKMPAAHRHAQMKAARATAAHAMHVLSLEQRAESPCKSQVPGVSDESCATLCVVRASCPEVCACEDDGSKEDGHVLKIDIDTSKKPKDWISGYYAWGWSEKPSNGTKGSNLGVQFSGDINVQGALHGVGAITLPCDETQSGFCKGQMDFFTGAGKSKTEAKEAVLKQYADNCRSCLMTKTDMARLPKKQFSVKAGVWRGKQLLSLGGGGTMWNVESLSGLTAGSKDIEDIKEAGFAGICFDIEETEGEQELIDAFEATFAMLKKEGLEVMVTTSHSAPYEASSDEARNRTGHNPNPNPYPNP